MSATVTGPGKTELIISSWYTVEIDSTPKITGLFSDVGGLTIEVEITEIKQTDATGNTVIVKRPGQTKYGEITLKRSMTDNKDFYNWVKRIRDGEKDFRAGGAITMLDSAGDPVASWKFSNAWPSKWAVSDLDASSNDAMTEDITLQIEMLERTK